METRVEAFKLYNDMAKQVLTLASALLVAIVGAVTAPSISLIVGPWVAGAIAGCLVSIFAGIILMGALVGNIQADSDIDAPEIRWAGRVQLIAFLFACIALAGVLLDHQNKVPVVGAQKLVGSCASCSKPAAPTAVAAAP